MSAPLAMLIESDALKIHEQLTGVENTRVIYVDISPNLGRGAK